jgi:hypothetical protein
MTLLEILFEDGMKKYYKILVSATIGVIAIFFLIWLGGVWVSQPNQTVEQIEEDLRSKCWRVQSNMNEYVMCLAQTVDYMDKYNAIFGNTSTSTQDVDL